MVIKLVLDNKKDKKKEFIDDVMRDDDLSFLYTALNMEKERALYLDEAIESGVSVSLFYKNIRIPKSKYQFPEIYEGLKKQNIQRKQYYPTKDFDEIYIALSIIFYEAFDDEKKNDMFSLDNIERGMKDLFDDPNDIISKYKTFFAWEEGGFEDEVLAFWSFNISSYGSRLYIIDELRKLDYNPSDHKKPNLYRVK